MNELNGQSKRLSGVFTGITVQNGAVRHRIFPHTCDAGGSHLSKARLFRFLFIVVWACALSLRLPAQTDDPLPVIPLPAHVARGQGQFLIDGNFGIVLDGYKEPRLQRAKQRFLDRLSQETGIPLWREAQFNKPNFVIRTSGPSDRVQQLGENESYHLQISTDHVELTAPNPLGILHGLQTFLQLVRNTPDGFNVPVVSVDDSPRFPWRGLMIDSSRHFMPVAVIERTLNGMEAVKLNVLHWHLSDDQGFRVESRKFPLLQKDGSDGDYYTQKQIRQVIVYARDRGIRVVPEFDMPCHTQSWFVGYPQLAAGKGPYHIARHMGVHSAAMDPTKESTYKFINAFIGEMAHLFPDAYFHIGGDECNGKEWDSNPRIQRFTRAHGMASNAALQARFTARVQTLVARHHRIMVGWDEVLQPGTPKRVVIQSWRGQASLARAARQGNRSILSTGYYIDLNRSAAYHYLVDPLGGDAAKLDPEQQARILGGEATMWSEFVSPENVDSRIWPRTAAIAERLWSPEQVRDVASMYTRLAVVAQELEFYRINPRATTNLMLQRMSGTRNPQPLSVLAAVVQPPQGYTRNSNGYTTFTPLNRLVDAVPPESIKARVFHDLVEQIVGGHATDQQWQQARQWLVLWRDNDALLQPSLGESKLTQELIPVSHNLHQVAVIGLQALDNMRNHNPGSAAAYQNNLQFIKSAEQQDASLLDMVAPSVELLVRATRTEK